MTPEEERNERVSQLWEQTFNDDIERMCDECYAADCVVESMGTGEVLHGREELRVLERRMLDAFPDRRMTVTRRIVSGDTVVCEATSESTHLGEFMGRPPTGERRRHRACVVLTFRDGQIVSDHTYSDTAFLVKLGLTSGAFVRALAEQG